MSRRGGTISIIVGLFLLIGAPTIWQLQQPDETVGEVEPTQNDVEGAAGRTAGEIEPTPNDGDRDTPQTDDEPESAQNVAEGATPQTDGRRFEVSAVSGALEHLAAPSRLTLPAAGVDAPIVPVGFAEDGTMEVPTDVGNVGWFAPGIRPGRNGTAVLAGHVDSRTQGPGAFYELRRTEVGDAVTVTHEDGQTFRWRITGRTSYGKSEIPLSEIFERGGPPRLALITCGGTFDEATRSYQENVVVYAEPA